MSSIGEFGNSGSTKIGIARNKLISCFLDRNKNATKRSIDLYTCGKICGFCVAGGGTGGGPLLTLGAGLTAGAELEIVPALVSLSTMFDLSPVALSFGMPPENKPPKFGGPPLLVGILTPLFPTAADPAEDGSPLIFP